MKNIKQKLFAFISAVLVCTVISAQSKEWNRYVSHDGKVSIKSSIAERINEKGNTVDALEYVAISNTEGVSMRNFISVIKNASNHKIILASEQSKLVKSISDNEWIFYYYFDFPWPMSNADCVVKAKLSENIVTREAYLSVTAAPAMYESRDVERMTFYNVKYIFKEHGNGKGELRIESNIIATMQAPRMLVNLWFPEGPADILRRIISLASEK